MSLFYKLLEENYIENENAFYKCANRSGKVMNIKRKKSCTPILKFFHTQKDCRKVRLREDFALKVTVFKTNNWNLLQIYHNIY